MRGFRSRLRFLAAFGWCRNDMGEPPPVDIRYFRRNDARDAIFPVYLIPKTKNKTRSSWVGQWPLIFSIRRRESENSPAGQTGASAQGRSRYVRILGMEQPQDQPLHGDSPRSRFNATLIFGLVIAVIGLVSSAPFLVILGLIGAGFGWFTNAKRYLIYTNALVIVYGRPRVKAISFPEIADLEMLVTPMGNRLRVRLVNGKRIMITVQNTEEFQTRLDEALEKFNSTYNEQNIIDQESDRPTPY